MSDSEQIETELAEHEAAIARLGDASEPSEQEELARKLVDKALALHSLDRLEEELLAYDAVIDRFGETTDPGVSLQLARALFDKGIKLNALGQKKRRLDASAP